MRRRVSLALVLLSGLVGLTPLADASPPDPLWIAGIYDAVDYDDVVALRINTDASGQYASLVAVEPFPLVVESLALPAAAAPAVAGLLAFHLRSPPIP